MRYMTEYGEPKLGKVALDIGLAFVAIIAMVILWPFNSVPTGYRGVVTQFGSIVNVEDEGLVILPPWNKLSIFSIRAEQADVKGAEGATSDTQPVNVSMTVRYSIATNRIAEVFEKYSHDGDLSSYVQTATHEVFKAVTAKYTAPDLIAQRSAVSAEIAAALRVKLDVYGAQVINIDMTGFSFSQSYMSAINDKVTQDQLLQTADKRLLTVESEQKQKVAVATAEANARKAEADGQAYANIKLAEAQAEANLKIATAQAEALKIQNAALSQNKDVLELRRIEVEQTKASRWNGQLPQNIYGSAPLPFLSVGK